MSVESMSSPLTRKLQHAVRLGDRERAHLDRLARHPVSLAARETIVSEGERCGSLYVLVSGWACRFKSLPGFSRQIVGFLVPGDHVFCDPALADRMDYGVCSLTRCDVAETSLDELEALVRESPVVDLALKRGALVDDVILREWLLSLGRRPAEKRMAHLFCELLARLQVVGLAQANSFPLPLTQAMLGDALGLSPAHVNRSLQNLRGRRLLIFDNGVVEIPSVEQLQRFAGFVSRYLHLGAADRVEASPSPVRVEAG